MTFEGQRRARALFDAALDREPAERRAFLAAACGHDEALRAEIEALLAAHERAEADEDADPRESGEQPGERIGHYKLRQKIGEGGFGVVWMAEQEEPVRRKVALKVLKPGMDTAQVVARFEAERQALALMDHPNIAKVFDGGATPAGRPYFVMELVKGVPITKFADDTGLSLQQRLELFVPVCQAVQHAHMKGVIHRDLKPSNVLVTLHDGVAVPKVIDFGIAKATAGRLTEKSVFTEFRQMLGTPEYMAPEQAELSGLDVDTRADIYSLGVLLYELLTGTRPFDLKTLLEVGYAEMLRTIKEVDPPKPSTRVSTLGAQVTGIAKQRHVSARSLSSLMRGDLDWIVMRALEKERSRRYETATALAEDVLRHLRHEPVMAGPPSGAYRLRKYVRRNRLAVAAGAAITVSLLGGAIASSLGYLEAKAQTEAARAAERQAEAERALAVKARNAEAEQRRAAELAQSQAEQARAEEQLQKEAAVASRREAEEQSDLARREAAKARMVGELLSSMLSSSDPHEDKGRDYPVRMVLADFERSLGTRLEGEPEIEVELRRVVGNSYLALGMDDAAETHLRRVLEIEQQLWGERHPKVAQAQFDLARLSHARGMHADALAILQSVEESPQVEDVRKARANRVNLLAARCDNLRHMGQLREAEAAGRQALALSEEQDGPQGALTNLPRSSLARTLLDAGRMAEAEPLLRQCLASVQEAGTASSIERTNLAAALIGLGRLEEAEALLREALEADRNRLGDAHPEIARSLCNLGALLHQRGDLDAAEEVFTECLEIQRRFLGPKHADIADALQNLGIVHSSRGDLVTAERLQQESLAMRQELLGDTHPAIAESLSALAGLRWQAGQRKAAEDLYRKAIEIRQRAGQDRHPQLARDMAHLGVVLQQGVALGQRRRTSEPEQLFRRAADVAQASLGPEHPEVVQDLLNLAMTQYELGGYASAIATLHRLLDLRRVSGGAGDPLVENETRMLLRALSELGEWTEAESVASQLLEMQGARLGTNHPDNLEARVLLARSLSMQGKEAESSAAQQQVGDLIADLRSRGGADSANALALLGTQLLRWGELEESARRFEEAEELLAACPERERPESLTAQVQVLRALVLLESGDPAAAESYARRSLGIRERIAEGSFAHFSAMAILGRALSAQGRLAEAEPLLLEACERMDPPFQARDKLQAALASLIHLYEVQGRSEQAALWKEKLAGLDTTQESGR